MFHHWMSTDEPDQDSCLGCGVVAPDFGEGVISDHSPLPLFCPGPDVDQPHHFTADVPGSITCAHCTCTIDENTEPDTVNWECIRDE